MSFFDDIGSIFGGGGGGGLLGDIEGLFGGGSGGIGSLFSDILGAIEGGHGGGSGDTAGSIVKIAADALPLLALL